MLSIQAVPLKCPACHRTLTPLTIAGVSIDVCRDGCAGAWFDQGELRTVALSQAAEQVLAGIASNATVRADLGARRRCPKCPDSVLMRHFSSPARAVTIDECPTCGGIWLDSGEIDRVQSGQMPEEARRQAVRQLFEAGAIDERMALIRRQIEEGVPYEDNVRSRIASCLVVVSYVVAVSKFKTVWPMSLLAFAFGLVSRSYSYSYSYSRDVGTIRVLVFCVIPFLCVWFPAALGSLGPERLKNSPRSLVWFFGWVVLLLPVIVAAILFAEGVR